MRTEIQEPLDYLTVGHITKDVVENGYTLGGTASYSPLTALAFGLRAGSFTPYGDDISVSPLDKIVLVRKPSQFTATFENIETPTGRRQHLFQITEPLMAADIPEFLTTAKILHLGPLTNAVDPDIITLFPEAFIGITPQGWMRKRDKDGWVGYQEWVPPQALIDRADAVVISVDDVYSNEALIADYALKFKIFIVTEGFNGARVYWNGDVRRFLAPKVEVVDPTGAGDIFAAAFFVRYEASRDPWESAAFAVNIASSSVTRKGLLGVPSAEEIQANMIKVTRGSSLS